MVSSIGVIVIRQPVPRNDQVLTDLSHRFDSGLLAIFAESIGFSGTAITACRQLESDWVVGVTSPLHSSWPCAGALECNRLISSVMALNAGIVPLRNRGTSDSFHATRTAQPPPVTFPGAGFVERSVRLFVLCRALTLQNARVGEDNGNTGRQRGRSSIYCHYFRKARLSAGAVGINRRLYCGAKQL